ncbi:MAG: presqualene diphosphate synthase HpnD [Verrucomicrobiota bacterium]
MIIEKRNAIVAGKIAIQLCLRSVDFLHPNQKLLRKSPIDMQESRTITRKSASNLALAFVLLPKAKRDAMSALYAFCREVDDVADNEETPVEKRRAELILWRNDIRKACQGGKPELVVNQELQPAIVQYHLSFEHFDDLICGVEMDLDINRYENFENLEKYCYHVASVVGLLSIEIFGYENPACRDYAIHLGKALQLTNILRDVKTDAERGRIYLPTSELARFQVSPEEIFRGEYSPRFRALAESTAQRARHFYQCAQQTLPPSDRKSMVAAELMGSVYWRLLQKLERENFNVFGPRTTRLNKAQKILLVFRAWFRLASGRLVPNYGTR